MAGSTEGEIEVQCLGVLALAVMALLAGVVVHSFIIAINVNDWWKGRLVTAVDHIVTSVCISRMCAQCEFVLYLFVSTVSLSNMHSNKSLVIMGVVYTFYVYANIWLTALLSVVLFVKISTLQTRLFLYLRRMLLQRTVYFIVASVLLSAVSSLNPLRMSIIGVIEGGIYNATMDGVFTNCTNDNFVYNYTAGNFLPLLFCCSSSILLFISLYFHTRRMKMSSNLTSNLETYYSVMTFVSFTFIYNITYFVVDVISAFYYYNYCMVLLWLNIIFDFLPVLHSSYLIYRTAKLRNQMSKFLQNLIDSLFQRREAQSRDNIEVVN